MINFSKIIEQYFAFLKTAFGFIKIDEHIGDQGYNVTFSSNIFSIKIETYRRELYLYLSSTYNDNNQVNLFVLLEYLNQSTTKKIKSNYFPNVQSDEECFKLQADYLSKLLITHMSSFKSFFQSKNIDTKMPAIENYMKKTYPNLFPQ